MFNLYLLRTFLLVSLSLNNSCEELKNDSYEKVAAPKK